MSLLSPFALVLLVTAASHAAALPVPVRDIARQVSSYGRYSSYGHYSGPYEDYPSSPLEAEIVKLKGGAE